jgi:Domain of unknown function (DUF5666)
MKLLIFAKIASTLSFSLALLTACGGGDGVGSGGTGITGSSGGIQTGNVSGFGSIIIEGNKYDDSVTVVTADIEPGNALTMAASSIQLGMQVKAIFDSNERISAVTILPTLIGKVASISLSSGGDSIVVAGQTVRLQSSAGALTAPTIFEGFSGAKDIAIADKLEVHGYIDTDGSILATRVELIDDSNAITRLTGVVSGQALTSTGQSFKLSGLLVTLNTTAKILPAGSSIKNGDKVSVWAKVDAIASTSTPGSVQVLAANVVRIDATNSVSSNNQPWRIAGPIASVDSNAKTMKVDDVAINFTNAILKNAQLADLQKGAVVRVKGTGAAAAEVELLKGADKVKIELAGVVTDFNSAASFKVRNSLVNATAANIVFLNGSKANLGDGALVELEGNVINGVIVPTSITFKTTEDNRTQSFIGQVNNFNANTGGFTILGVQAKITNATVFKTFSGGNASMNSFANGATVQVKGAFAQGQFVATEIRLGPSAVQEVKIEGVASNVNLVTRSLTLNGFTVNWVASTDINTLAKLKNGARVIVEGLSNSGAGSVVSAAKIQVKDR